MPGSAASRPDTPYELVCPLRGVKGVRLLVRADVLAVQERVSVPTGDGQRRTQWKAPAHRRLDAVKDVGEIRLTGGRFAA